MRVRLILFMFFLPVTLQAQSIHEEVKGLHAVLASLYTEMMPLCSQLIGVGQGIAGFAALWYIASRVWRHLSRAEPIDFYPLFRPFAVGLCIALFPQVLGIINGVLQPTVSGTESMVTASDKAIETLLAAKAKAIQQTDKWQMFVGASGEGDYSKWYSYMHDGEDVSEEGFFAGIGNSVKFMTSKFMYGVRNTIKEYLSQVLQLLFAAASLCINTIRTFNLVVLAILGPLTFGLAVFDGFQQTLYNWMARYINIFLWLPVANLFGAIIGKIQENMLHIDLEQIQQAGDTFFSTKDMAYMVFMLIGIIGYFTVPSIANSIVQVTGVGGITSRVTQLMNSTVHQSISGARSYSSSTQQSATNNYPTQAKDMYSGNYQKDKVSGDTKL